MFSLRNPIKDKQWLHAPWHRSMLPHRVWDGRSPLSDTFPRRVRPTKINFSPNLASTQKKNTSNTNTKTPDLIMKIECDLVSNLNNILSDKVSLVLDIGYSRWYRDRIGRVQLKVIDTFSYSMRSLRKKFKRILRFQLSIRVLRTVSVADRVWVFWEGKCDEEDEDHHENMDRRTTLAPFLESLIDTVSQE